MIAVIILSIIVVVCISFYLCVPWTVHLEMNPNGKFIKYDDLINLINKRNDWRRSKKFKNSFFLDIGNNFQTTEGFKQHFKWQIHASKIVMNGENYKLNPIGYIKFHQFKKKWNVPFE